MHDCHQLFDSVSCTFTYVLTDPVTRDAVMIDPVDTQFDVYSALLDREGLRLRYVLETHTHADHITGAGRLRERTNSRLAGRSRDAFIRLMAELRLPRPKLIDVAVPANRRLGLDAREA